MVDDSEMSLTTTQRNDKTTERAFARVQVRERLRERSYSQLCYESDSLSPQANLGAIRSRHPASLRSIAAEAFQKFL